MLSVSAAARLFLTFEDAANALQLAQDARARGKGRRPSVFQVARLEQRVFTASGAYSSALEALGSGPSQAAAYEAQWRKAQAAQAGTAPGQGVDAPNQPIPRLKSARAPVSQGSAPKDRVTPEPPSAVPPLGPEGQAP